MPSEIEIAISDNCVKTDHTEKNFLFLKVLLHLSDKNIK